MRVARGRGAGRRGPDLVRVLRLELNVGLARVRVLRVREAVTLVPAGVEALADDDAAEDESDEDGEDEGGDGGVVHRHGCGG